MPQDKDDLTIDQPRIQQNREIQECYQQRLSRILGMQSDLTIKEQEGVLWAKRWLVAGVEAVQLVQQELLTELGPGGIKGLASRPELVCKAVVALNLSNRWIEQAYQAVEAYQHSCLANAVTLVRGAFETIMLQSYFEECPDAAEDWLFKGKRISQGDIRKRLKSPEAIRGYYGWLSEYTHPNFMPDLVLGESRFRFQLVGAISSVNLAAAIEYRNLLNSEIVSSHRLLEQGNWLWWEHEYDKWARTVPPADE